MYAHLDVDEDFEAFRHLARQVDAIDICVMVDGTRPAVFTQVSQTSSIPVCTQYLSSEYPIQLLYVGTLDSEET